MRTIQQFIDEGRARLELDSKKKLATALGYKSSGFLSQLYRGKKGLPEEREDHWISTLRVPIDQQAEFRQAAAASRARQKADIREDYLDLQGRTAELDARTVRLEVAVRELVAFLKAKGVKLPKGLIDRIKAALDT